MIFYYNAAVKVDKFKNDIQFSATGLHLYKLSSRNHELFATLKLQYYTLKCRIVKLFHTLLPMWGILTDDSPMGKPNGLYVCS